MFCLGTVFVCTPGEKEERVQAKRAPCLGVLQSQTHKLFCNDVLKMHICESEYDYLYFRGLFIMRGANIKWQRPSIT